MAIEESVLTTPDINEVLAAELVERARELLVKAAGLLITGELYSTSQDELLQRTVELARYVNSALGLLEVANDGAVIENERAETASSGSDVATLMVSLALQPDAAANNGSTNVPASAEAELRPAHESPADVEAEPLAAVESSDSDEIPNLEDGAEPVGARVTGNGKCVELTPDEFEIFQALLQRRGVGTLRAQIDDKLTFLQRCSNPSKKFVQTFQTLQAKLEILSLGALQAKGNTRGRKYYLTPPTDGFSVKGVGSALPGANDAPYEPEIHSSEPVDQPRAEQPKPAPQASGQVVGQSNLEADTEAAPKPAVQGIERSGMVLAIDGVVAAGRFVPISKEERRVVRELFETGRSFTLTELTQAVCRREDVSVAECEDVDHWLLTLAGKSLVTRLPNGYYRLLENGTQLPRAHSAPTTKPKPHHSVPPSQNLGEIPEPVMDPPKAEIVPESQPSVPPAVLHFDCIVAGDDIREFNKGEKKIIATIAEFPMGTPVHETDFIDSLYDRVTRDARMAFNASVLPLLEELEKLGFVKIHRRGGGKTFELLRDINPAFGE